jgi:hypothetical protein
MMKSNVSRIASLAVTLGLALAASVSASAAPGMQGASTVTASQTIAATNAKIEASTAACKKGEACKVTIVVEAQGEFHVNKEYPQKFVADETVKWAKKEFGKASGDYAESGEKKFTITATFTPDKAGDADVTGNLRYAVCSATQCAPAVARIAFKASVK